MGVPALFRWLSKKYPKIISPVIEELPEELENGDGSKTKIPVDGRKPNPNGEEMDNLYLDMNGIVHPCSHPEDRPPPASEEEMMLAIFEYTDRVVNMVRPRKLLMIAVDGVAPRAKMNQQRSRRFRSAQEAAEKDAAAEEYHRIMLAKGIHDGAANGQGEEKPTKTWDSNSITPGTPFMDLLAKSLRYWVSYKMSTDPAWERLKVIISDATVPGEGEHKIMNFVRSQRSSPTHDPNTRHVIYGLDADLIMLGIATHEPHFRVLREDVFANDTKPGHCRKCNQPGHIADQCRGAPAKAKPGEDGYVEKPLKPFIWLHVGILREYLAVEMSVPNQPFRFDLERALDDWVFMCFFVGNDFLPHLPSLDIREDGIDTLIAIWRDNIPIMGGYVTKDGHVDLARAQVILEGLAKQEDAIFKRRREGELRQQEKERRREAGRQRDASKRQRMSGNGNRNGFGGGNEASGFGASGFDESVIRRGPKGGIVRGEAAPDINALPTFEPGQAQTRQDPRFLTHADVVGNANKANKSAAAALKEQLMGKQNAKPAEGQKAELEALFAGAASSNGSPAVLGKRTRDMIADDADDAASSAPSTPGRNALNKEIANPIDNGPSRGTSGALGGNSKPSEEQGMPDDTVKLWEEGYEERYYEQKFHVDPKDVEFRHKVARSYVEGLCWVLLYYFQGCPSWTWYYPFHYAPFAADFEGMGDMRVEFDKGKPFRPFEQLMGVMPAASNHTLPKVFHPLMTEDDSPIKEFYPIDFEVDLNGKKFAWQGVALLPFIDEKRLLDAMHTKYPLLTEDEQERNAFGNEALIFSTRHPLHDQVATSWYGKKQAASKFKLDSKISEGLNGKVEKEAKYIPGSDLKFPVPNAQIEHETYGDLDADESATVIYHMPPSSVIQKSMLLAGVQFADPVLDYQDVQITRARAEKSGRSHGGVQLSQNGDRSDGRRMNFAARDGGGYQNGGGGYQGNNGYGPNGGYGHGGGPQQPFAQLPPHLAQQAAAHGFPPPPSASMEYPPSHQQGGYGGPPPPRRQEGGYGSGGYQGQNGGYRGQQNGGGYSSYQGQGGYSSRGGNGNGYSGGGGYQGGGRGGGGGGGSRRY